MTRYDYAADVPPGDAGRLLEAITQAQTACGAAEFATVLTTELAPWRDTASQTIDPPPLANLSPRCSRALTDVRHVLDAELTKWHRRHEAIEHPPVSLVRQIETDLAKITACSLGELTTFRYAELQDYYRLLGLATHGPPASTR